MTKIPFLFLKEDEELIKMYKEYFRHKGYGAIILRNGIRGIERAINSGPSMVSLDFETLSETKSKTMNPVILITDKNIQSEYDIAPLLAAGKVLAGIKDAVED